MDHKFVAALLLFSLSILFEPVSSKDELQMMVDSLKASRAEAERTLTKEQLAEVTSIRERIEKYEEEMIKFEKYVREPCEIINNAFSPSLANYYDMIKEIPDLGERINNSGDTQLYKWLERADVCRNVLKDFDKMQDAAEGYDSLVNWLDDIVHSVSQHQNTVQNV